MHVISNCQQHIHERYSRQKVATAVDGLRERIAELEAEVERLRSTPQPGRAPPPGAPR